MSNFFKSVWDNTAGGLLWKPIKKATGLTDAQMIGLSAATVAGAPFVLPALSASGAGAAGAAEGAAGVSSLTGAEAAANPYSSMEFLKGAAESSTNANMGLWDKAVALGEKGAGYADKYAKPAFTGLQAASMANGLLGSQDKGIQGAQLNHQAPQFAGLLTQPQDDTDMRRQAYNQRIQGLLGGSYGRFA